MALSKKFNREKLIKTLHTFCAKSDIKPEITGINVEGSSLIATDSYRLACIKLETNLPDGIYNLKTMEKINGDYPDWKKVGSDLEEVEIMSGTTYALAEKIDMLAQVSKGFVILPDTSIRVDRRFLLEAINLMNEVGLNFDKFPEVKITGKIDANRVLQNSRPIKISIADNFVWIMPSKI